MNVTLLRCLKKWMPKSCIHEFINRTHEDHRKRVTRTRKTTINGTHEDRTLKENRRKKIAISRTKCLALTNYTIDDS